MLVPSFSLIKTYVFREFTMPTTHLPRLSPPSFLLLSPGSFTTYPSHSSLLIFLIEFILCISSAQLSELTVLQRG